MTRTEHVLYRRRWTLYIVAALLFLGGAVAVVWLRVDKAAAHANELAQEANLRGTAVSTLAGDVRRLRAQLKAEGKTPKAPDPAKAVKDLKARAEVPVPIQGPRGAKGEKGDPGKPAPTITPSPGASGASGKPAPTITPQPGKDGQDGQDGKDGTNGRNGQPPVSWTWEYNGVQYTCHRADPFDPQAPRYECGDGEAQQPTEPPASPSPSPSPSGGGPLLGLALAVDPARRIYL